MLPNQLKQIKTLLEAKASVNRTVWENELLADLIAVDKAVDDSSRVDAHLTENVTKRATARSGPILGACPQCGR